MAFLDFLTGNTPQNQQQGLPPEHSAAARLLELLGGFTGFAPLAGIGYLADQSTEERYNEAVWPRFKSMLAKSGVPQQKLDNLDLLPMQARVGVANALWQGTLRQQRQQKQSYVPEMLPSGQEAFVDPLSGKILSTLPKGAYTQSFKPARPLKPPGEKILTGENAILAQSLGLPLDVSRMTPAQAARYDQAKTRLDLARRPVTNVNVAYPVSPSDIMAPPTGMKAPGAVLMRSKGGHLTAEPSPIGPQPKVSAEKPFTINDYLLARGRAMQQAKEALTKPGLISKGVPSGPVIAAKANDILAGMGLDPTRPRKLKDGDKVRMSNGQVLTWHDN